MGVGIEKYGFGTQKCKNPGFAFYCNVFFIFTWQAGILFPNSYISVSPASRTTDFDEMSPILPRRMRSVSLANISEYAPCPAPCIEALRLKSSLED